MSDNYHSCTSSARMSLLVIPFICAGLAGDFVGRFIGFVVSASNSIMTGGPLLSASSTDNIGITVFLTILKEKAQACGFSLCVDGNPGDT